MGVLFCVFFFTVAFVLCEINKVCPVAMVTKTMETVTDGSGDTVKNMRGRVCGGGW